MTCFRHALALLALSLAPILIAGCGDDEENAFAACLERSGGERLTERAQLDGLTFAQEGPSVFVEELSFASVVALRGEEGRLLVSVDDVPEAAWQAARGDVDAPSDAVLLPWARDWTAPTERCMDEAAPDAVFP